MVNRGTIGLNSLPKTVTRQRRDCDVNPGPSAPEFSTLTTRLPSHPLRRISGVKIYHTFRYAIPRLITAVAHNIRSRPPLISRTF